MTTSFLKTIIFMKDEMRYTKTMIETVFVKCARLQEATAEFYNHIAEGIKNGQTLSEVWRKEISCIPHLNVMLKNDLLELGEILGTVELDMQNNIITNTIEKIKHIKEEQENELKTKGNLYPKIGFGAGVLVAILLM